MVGKITKEAVLEILKTVDEPEMGMNIVDMGLVYEVKVGKTIEIKMTVPCPGCFVSQMILESVKEAVRRKFKKAPKVELVFDPPWNPKMIRDPEAK